MKRFKKILKLMGLILIILLATMGGLPIQLGRKPPNRETYVAWVEEEDEDEPE